MNILIIDDHPLMRKGLLYTLSLDDNIKNVQEASNIEEAMKLLENANVDIAIVDLNLGREDGLEIVIKAKEKNFKTKFIILTSSIKKEDFIRAQEKDIDGYIVKEACAEDVIYAVHVVARGKRFFHPEILQYETNKIETNNMGQLTEREKDVLIELGKGLSNVKIAQALFISENTVKKHVSNILSKLGLSHRTEVALLVKDILRNFESKKSRLFKE